jgi:hypothetical protein
MNQTLQKETFFIVYYRMDITCVNYIDIQYNDTAEKCVI